jgi:hypothetical protein
MNRPSLSPAQDTDEEYRAIEAALLESARGRWFLAEHGRRARRLDSALLEDAIGRLQTSLRDPPALLDQLQNELSDLKSHIGTLRAELLAKPQPAAISATDGLAPRDILKAAEDVHEIAWSLQANPFDPKGCEEIARSAARLYTLSQEQATHSARTLAIAEALEGAMTKVDAVLETINHERTIDAAPAKSSI